jgi:hypothetical protein
MERITLDPRFNGPPHSGNGGYASGVVAGLLGGAGVRVSLRAPPPLGRDLDVVRDNGHLEMRDGEVVIAQAGRAELGMAATEPVDPERAAAATRAGFQQWTTNHPFPTCFVCGAEREPRDGLEIYPGPLGDGRFAAVWTPALELAGDDGLVRDEFVWSALDCPSSAPVATWGEGHLPVVLGRLQVERVAPVKPRAEHVLVSWPLAVDGRKRHAGCALFDAGGELLGLSRALWIELRR